MAIKYPNTIVNQVPRNICWVITMIMLAHNCSYCINPKHHDFSHYPFHDKTWRLVDPKTTCIIFRSEALNITNQTSDTPWVWFELAQNLSSDVVERNCIVVIFTTPKHYCYLLLWTPINRGSHEMTSMSVSSEFSSVTVH